MQHLDEGTIHAWLDGALDAEEAARVEQHAAECAECRSAVVEARGLVAGASRILSALDGGLGTGDWGQGTRHTGRGARGTWRLVRGAWRAAAAILIVAAGTTLVMVNRPNGKPSLMRQVSSDTALARVFMAPKVPVSASPVAPSVAVPTVDTVGESRIPRPPSRAPRESVLGARPGSAAPSNLAVPRRAMAAESSAPMSVAAAAPPVAALMSETSQRPASRVPRPDTSVPAAKVRVDKRMAVADAIVDSTRRTRRDSAGVDSMLRRSSLEAVVATRVAASAPQAPRATIAAGATAPSSVARSETRVAPLGYAVNYAGCYVVSGQGGLPSLLSLDNTQFGAQSKVAELAGQRPLRFGVSSVEANQRKTANGWWAPIEGGGRGVRISIDNRAPIAFTAFGDSLVSAPDSVTHAPAVTLHRMNCPNR